MRTSTNSEIQTESFYLGAVPPNVATVIENSEDASMNSSLIWVSTVCPILSVQIYTSRIITVNTKFKTLLLASVAAQTLGPRL